MHILVVYDITSDQTRHRQHIQRGTPMNDPFLLPATMLRQYLYCARIPYWSYCAPLRRPTTYKMEEGLAQHEHTAELEERRSLRAYGLQAGTRHFDVPFHSQTLGMRGRIDMLIELPEELVPVEWKHTERSILMLHHKYQLAMYALLAEEQFGKPVHRCFVYLIPLKRALEVPIVEGMRRYAHRAAGELRAMLLAERMPAPTSRRARCRDCEFRRFCNDIDWDDADETVEDESTEESAPPGVVA